MPFETIPAVPVPLTVEQAETMAQRQIKKHYVAVVLLHWFNAVVWLLELATGAALIVAPDYRFMPQWYLVMMQQAFGSRANLLRVHIAIGITWTIVLLAYAIFGWKHYLHAEVLRKEIGLDKDDVSWLKTRTLLILGRTQEKLPPQGAYNAGQKMYALLVYSAVPVIILTGLVMSFHLIATAAVAWAMVLHFLAVGMVVSGLMIHVYMGAVFPEEKPAFYSMITGMVNELYAYRHHFKWWREIKLQEREWESELKAEASGCTEESTPTSYDEPNGDQALCGHPLPTEGAQAARG